MRGRIAVGGVCQTRSSVAAVERTTARTRRESYDLPSREFFLDAHLIEHGELRQTAFDGQAQFALN